MDFEAIEDIEGIRNTYDELVKFESRGWKGQQEKCLEQNHFLRDFYFALLTDYTHTNNAVITKLLLNGTSVSMYAGVVIENTVFCLPLTLSLYKLYTHPATIKTGLPHKCGKPV